MENTSRTAAVYPNTLKETQILICKEFGNFPITMSYFAVWFIMQNLVTEVKTGKGPGEKQSGEYVEVSTLTSLARCTLTCLVTHVNKQ
jgi:hypothetical protein